MLNVCIACAGNIFPFHYFTFRTVNTNNTRNWWPVFFQCFIQSTWKLCVGQISKYCYWFEFRANGSSFAWLYSHVTDSDRINCISPWGRLCSVVTMIFFSFTMIMLLWIDISTEIYSHIISMNKMSLRMDVDILSIIICQ